MFITPNAFATNYTVRYSSDLNKPKLFDTKTFKYEANSVVITTNRPLTSEHLFSPEFNLQIYIEDTYLTKIPTRVTKNSLSRRKIILERSKYEKEYFFTNKISDIQKKLNTKLCVHDLSELHNFSIYRKSKTLEYDIIINQLASVVESTIRFKDKKVNIPITLPSRVFSYETIKKALTLKGTRLIGALPSYGLLPILEIAKLFDKDTFKKSIFYPLDQYLIDNPRENPVFIFSYNGVSSVMPIRALFAISDNSSIEDKNFKKDSVSNNLKDLVEYIGSFYKTDIKQTVDEIADELNDEEEEVKALITIPKSPDRKPDAKEEAITLLSSDNIDKKITARIVKQIEENKKVRDKLVVTTDDTKLVKSDYPDNIGVIEKEMLDNTIDMFDKQYIENILNKDSLAVIYAFERFGYAIKNVEQTHSKTLLEDEITYKVTMLQPTGTAVTYSIVVPQPDPEGNFTKGGKNYVMYKQKLDAPVKKINPLQVGLTSYFSKMFISKGTLSAYNTGKVLNKELIKADDKSIVVVGESKPKGVKLPLWYSIFGRGTRSFIFNKEYFLFDYLSRETLLDGTNVKLETLEKHGVLIAFTNSKKGFVVDKNNDVIELDKNGKVITNHGGMVSFFNVDMTKLPIEFVDVRMGAKKIPIVMLLLSYLNLDGLIAKTKPVIKSEPTGSVNEYAVTFKDKTFYLDRSDSVNALIFGGLVRYNKILRTFSYRELMNGEGVKDLFTTLGYGNREIREMRIYRGIWLDPMTRRAVKAFKQPEIFEDTLILAVEMLQDDSYVHPNNIETNIVKGYERLNGIMYKVISTAIKLHELKVGRVRSKVEINPYGIYTILDSDATFTLKEDTNPIAMLKQRENVTLGGVFGRSNDSITMNDRTYDVSEVGIFSEASKESADIGKTFYLSGKPNIDSTTGIGKETAEKDLTGSAVLSPASLLSPNALGDAGKRRLFIAVQANHVAPVANAIVLPLRTGYESVMPYRTDGTFSLMCKEAGTVTSVTKSSVKIKHKSGNKTYKLKTWYSRDTSGKTFKHSFITNLKNGDKIVIGDAIAFDPLWYGQDFFNRKRICYKYGALAKGYFSEEQEAFNDSATLHKDFAKEMLMEQTTIVSKVIDGKTKLTDIIGHGDKVTYNDPLFTMVSSDDVSNLSSDAKALLKDIGNVTPKVDAKGIVDKIEVIYNGAIKDKSASIRKLIEVSDKEMVSLKGVTGEVNIGYSHKGKKLKENEVIINFYITKSTGHDNGSKVIFGSQLKATTALSYDNAYSVYDNERLDFAMGQSAVSDRIVTSVDIMGTTNLILDKLNTLFMAE